MDREFMNSTDLGIQITADALERRALTRTTIFLKQARLLFSNEVGPIWCGVLDITNAGAGVRLANLELLPIDFDLSFDNFRTVRKCRLVWRKNSFLGIAFKN
jgi:hypothetical protein